MFEVFLWVKASSGLLRSAEAESQSPNRDP